eukprot:scaffold5697_cov363-Prasinococcus_capsulatus_cf.AAC.2
MRHTNQPCTHFRPTARVQALAHSRASASAASTAPPHATRGRPPLQHWHAMTPAEPPTRRRESGGRRAAPCGLMYARPCAWWARAPSPSEHPTRDEHPREPRVSGPAASLTWNSDAAAAAAAAAAAVDEEADGGGTTARACG